MEDEEKDLAEKGMNLNRCMISRNGEAIKLWVSDSVSHCDLGNQPLKALTKRTRKLLQVAAI